MKLLALSAGAEVNFARVQCARGAVSNGILKEGLQQQLGNFSRSRFWLNLIIENQPFSQPKFLNSEIQIREFQLFGQAAEQNRHSPSG